MRPAAPSQKYKEWKKTKLKKIHACEKRENSAVKDYLGDLPGLQKFGICSRINEGRGEWYSMSEIILTFKYTTQDSEIKKESRVEISRDEGEGWREDFPTAAAPHRWFLFPAQPASALCGERLCPLGATISPSRSFQPGIHAAFPVPFPQLPRSPGSSEETGNLYHSGRYPLMCQILPRPPFLLISRLLGGRGGGYNN